MEKYIFFDYEAQQETGIHVPNLIIAKYFCDETFTFKTSEEFCNWLVSKQHKGYTAIAHYARGYDSHFILQYCINNTVRPFTIYNGSKLMLLQIETINLKVIDSHNFVATSLSEFSNTFGLDELKKSYFPHLFNIAENATYKGPIPDKRYYDPDLMEPK